MIMIMIMSESGAVEFLDLSDVDKTEFTAKMTHPACDEISQTCRTCLRDNPALSKNLSSIDQQRVDR